MSAKSVKKKETEPETFEQRLEELTAIIEKMESAELPLDDVIDSYEKGVQYLQFCQKKLKAAELKVEELEAKMVEEQIETDDPKEGIDLF